MLLIIAFALFALMLVSWMLAPSAEAKAALPQDVPAAPVVTPVLQH
ncbi:MAG: hypothetical protein WBA46_09840 [Thermomicrobiales bacterium]